MPIYPPVMVSFLDHNGAIRSWFYPRSTVLLSGLDLRHFDLVIGKSTSLKVDRDPLYRKATR